MKVGDLFIALGFQVDSAKLKDFNDKIGQAQKNLLKVGAGATAAIYGLNRFLNSSVQSAEAMRNYREQTGYATEGLYAFYNAASRANTNIDLSQIIDTYRSLADVIARAQRGDLPAGSLWAGLDNIVDSTPQQLIDRIYDKIPELLERYKGDRALILQDLAEIGISPDVGQALFSDRKQFDALRNLPTPTEKQIESLQNLAQSYKTLSNQYMIFKFRVSEKIAPSFEIFVDFISTKALPVLEKFIVNLMTDVVPKLQEFALNIATVFDAVREAVQNSGFEIDESTGIIAFLILLYTRLNPVRIAVVGLVFALNELGKMMRGENSIFSKIDKFTKEKYLGLLKFFESDAESPAGKKKRELSNYLYGEGAVSNENLKIRTPENYFTSNRQSGYPPMPAPVAPMEQQVTIAPNYNINTTANPRDMWDSLNMHEQYLIRNAMIDQMYGASGLKTGGM